MTSSPVASANIKETQFFALDDALGELLRPKGLDSFIFSVLVLVPCSKELL